MTDSYDVVVIGAGPAGYVAAIRCAQLGLKTACVDKWIGPDGKPSLGGTCLNAGCIPSKALLDSTHHYYRLCHQLSSHGITAKEISIDVKTMIERKNKLVKKLTDGIKGLFNSNSISWLQGHGKLLGGMRVEISPSQSSEKPYIVQASNVILATGSRSTNLPIAKVDQNLIVDSTGALSFTEVPKRLGIIGAGVIGLELGTVWRRLGSEVTLLEAQEEFLFMVDPDIAAVARKQFEKQGLNIRLGCRVLQAHPTKKDVIVRYQDKSGEHEFVVDKLLVAAGRYPYTENLFAQETGLLLDQKGFINVDEKLRTNLPNVYAVGDVVRGPMLAHKGSEEGIVVAETIKGHFAEVNYNTIPWVIYTEPEIAWTGKTERELKASGIKYNVGTFPFAASGRAMALEETAGMVKILSDAETDLILGIHIVGSFASELIAEAVLALEYSASSEDLALTIHAHPTMSEAIHEAALAVSKRAIHKVNK
ncbi:dihydrolipoyl dehydrogenase [bacterium]|nr:dihydrolipoyl dehydrogenase [bacterium]MCP5461957.1 dihydrolipoyl dehydrogenase [bacterium]